MVSGASVGAGDGVTGGFRLTNSIQVLRAPAGSVPDEEVLSGHRDAAFKPPGATILKCSDGIVCWVRLTLSRSVDAPEDWWLRLRAVRPGQARLYAAQGAMAEEAVQGAHQFPLNWRYVGVDRFFPVALPPWPATYYLRLENTPSADGFLLLQQAGFERQQRQLNTYLNASMGVAFALMVMNLVFWRWLRDTLFLHFALLLLAAVLLHAWQIVPSMGSPVHMGDPDLRGVLQSLMQAATVMFIARLFEFRRHLPRVARMTWVFVALNASAAVVAACGGYARIEPAVAVLDLAGMLASTAAAGWLLFGLRQWQFAWPAVLTVFLALASGLGRLRWLGLLEIGPDEGLGPTWAVARLIYMLLLAVTVADRTRQAEMQLRHARERSLEDAQRAERLLEDKVHQRTAELGHSNAQLAAEIERRRQAEAGLEAALASERKALQQQRQFVSLVSHEFRTPLAVIDAAAQSIELPGVQAAPRVAKIRRAVRGLTQLVVNCLAEDRLQSERMPLNAGPTDLRGVVEGLAQAFGPLEQERIRLHLPPGAVWVRGDAALLEIALHNLAQNAIKYSTPDQPVDIRLEVQAQAQLACVDVEDRGGGIPPDEQARIFERFYRGAGSRATRIGGTGLGLFLGTEIARAHGGSLVLLRSGAQGSVFRLRVPMAAASSAPPVPPASLAPSAESTPH